MLRLDRAFVQIFCYFLCNLRSRPWTPLENVLSQDIATKGRAAFRLRRACGSHGDDQQRPGGTDISHARTFHGRGARHHPEYLPPGGAWNGASGLSRTSIPSRSRIRPRMIGSIVSPIHSGGLSHVARLKPDQPSENGDTVSQMTGHATQFGGAPNHGRRPSFNPPSDKQTRGLAIAVHNGVSDVEGMSLDGQGRVETAHRGKG